MRKIFPLIIVLALAITSCVDKDLPDTNGMWQLKYTIDETNEKETIDTVFYSFQRQALFSYTWLTTNELNQEIAHVHYGYVDFPDDTTLHIKMDTNTNKEYVYQILPWKAPEVTFRIVRLKSKEMILEHKNTKYYFIKF